MTLIYFFSKVVNKQGPHNDSPFDWNEDGNNEMQLHPADPIGDDYRSDSDNESLTSDTDDDGDTNISGNLVCFDMINI